MATYLTNEDIEQRKAAGVKMNKLNCGWNLSPDLVLKVASIIENMETKTETDKRDKRILQLAFIEDMNASQIARLDDPLIIGTGNRSRGKPLSNKSILDICYKYLPEAKNRKYKGRTNTVKERRIALYKNRQQKKDNRPKACSTCGSRDNIELHHIIPLAAGGTNDYYNLINLCHDCHMKLHHTIYDSLSWGNSNPSKMK